MSLNIRIALGLGGVSPQDNPAAHTWEKRFYWPVLLATLLAIPAFYLEEFSVNASLRELGAVMDVVVFLTFVSELAVMMTVSSRKRVYLLHNWLSLAIIGATGLSILAPQIPGELTALFRLLRVAITSLLVARLVDSLRTLTPGSTPYILMIGFGLMLLSGGGFYWLEPTVHSYWDGIWLAFVSGMTVGYGDFIPTTGPARVFAGLVIVMTYAIMSLVTASIAAYFIGKEEKQVRREMHQDIRELRHELKTLREEMAGKRNEADSPKEP